MIVTRSLLSVPKWEPDNRAQVALAGAVEVSISTRCVQLTPSSPRRRGSRSLAAWRGLAKKRGPRLRGSDERVSGSGGFRKVCLTHREGASAAPDPRSGFFA